MKEHTKDKDVNDLNFNFKIKNKINENVVKIIKEKKILFDTILFPKLIEMYWIIGQEEKKMIL